MHAGEVSPTRLTSEPESKTPLLDPKPESPSPPEPLPVELPKPELPELVVPELFDEVVTPELPETEPLLPPEEEEAPPPSGDDSTCPPQAPVPAMNDAVTKETASSTPDLRMASL